MRIKSTFFLLLICFACISNLHAQDNAKFSLTDNHVVSDSESELVSGFKTVDFAKLNLAPPSNDDCVNATPLTIGAACINGTTVGSTVQAGESFGCNAGATQSVWYSFVATSTKMFITIDRTAGSGCYLSSSVQRGSCLPSTIISCEDAAGGPTMNIHNLIGLTVGATYYVQVNYQTGGPCGNNAAAGADFCIAAGVSVDCSTCSSPCGQACGFSSPPSVPQVTSTCTQFPLSSPLNAGQLRTFCYTFTAVNSTVTLGLIGTFRGCGSGNVSSFNWTLQSNSCGAILQSGTLSNLTMTGLGTGQTYTFCYTLAPACLMLNQWPYFVGAAPLPITLLSFTATAEKNTVELNWVTGSEENNEWFEIERSGNGETFESIHRIPGAGTTSETRSYFDVDDSPLIGTNYYRLKQTDSDGKYSYSPIVAAKVNDQDIIALTPNPANDKVSVKFISEEEGDFEFSIMNSKGHVTHAEKIHFDKGLNRINKDISSLSSGLYLIRVNNASLSYYKKLIIH